MSARYVTAKHVRALADRLSDRDWLVLERVTALRFVSGSQLTRLCFADSDDPAVNARSARRALLRLTRLAVLERLPRSVGGVRAGSAGFVYRLGLGGQRLAASRGLLPARQRRRSLIPGTLFLSHTLQIAELHTRLIESERSGRCELLKLDGEPSCHRINDGLDGQRVLLRPDTYVRLGIGPYEDSYFIEVDRGTEGSRALTDQLRRYVAYYQTGREQTEHGVFPKVLWLAETPERVRVIADCVAALPSEYRALFAVAQFDHALRFMLEPV
ncbi:MAG: replication-relaxation family protein [Solirubrobacteraceae bacterium]